MLCGIGGRTVQEAKENLSYKEVLSWVKYRNKRGCLNTNLRLERAIGTLTYLFHQVHGKNSKDTDIYDFLPFEDRPAEKAEEREITLEEMMAIW